MAFRVNGTGAMVKAEVVAGISAIASAQVATKVIAVSGCQPDMCIDAVIASAHSAVVVLQCQVLSNNNVEVTLWNTTNAAITLGSTNFRFVSK